MKSIIKKRQISTIILCTILGCIVFCCTETEQENNPNVSLLAPSGEQIASNMRELDNIATDFIAKKYGMDKEFEIKKLDYLPLSKGFAVMVKLQTSDGKKESFALARHINVHCASKKVTMEEVQIPQVKTRSAETDNESTLKLLCTQSSTSPINCSCELKAVYDHKNNSVSYSCDSDTPDCICELKITF